MFAFGRKSLKAIRDKEESMTKVTAADMNDFFVQNFKGDRGHLPEILQAENDFVTMHAAVHEGNLRPPNFISGPTQMALADHCAYCVIFTRLGITPMAVTSNLNIDFLRPCIGDKIFAEGRMIKLGKSLAVISVDIKGSGSDKLASRSTVTYALP